MSSRRIFTFLLVLSTFFSLFNPNAYAANRILRVSVLNSGEVEVPEVEEGAALDDLSGAENDVSGAENFEDLNAESAVSEKTSEDGAVELTEELISKEDLKEASEQEDICGFELPEEKKYNAQLIAVRRKLRVEPEENFRVKVFLKNTGTMPWFANKSKCLGPKISLGTERERDRDSSIYAEGLEGWETANRVGMDQFRADPGAIASFTFWGKAGEEPDIIKEYFAPILKDLQWIDNSQFSFELMVGDSGQSASDTRKKLAYASRSGSVDYIDLNAEKLLQVDLSEQNIYVKLGEEVLKVFRISTGAPSTPTPVGETKILIKQEIRVGVKAPHFIMPKYMMFRAGGFGFHALPSLGRPNGGIFWTEARRDIGIPVSHGCIRLLPEEADWLYEFTDVGTKVLVQR